MCDRAKNPKLFNRLLKPHWDSNLRSTYGVLTDLGPSGLLFICPCQRQSMSISSDFVAILKLSIANLRPHWHPLPPMEWHHFEAKTSIKFSKVSSRRPKILKLWTLWTLWTALTVTYSDLQCTVTICHQASPNQEIWCVGLELVPIMLHLLTTRQSLLDLGDGATNWRSAKISNEYVNVALQTSPKMP